MPSAGPHPRLPAGSHSHCTFDLKGGRAWTPSTGPQPLVFISLYPLPRALKAPPPHASVPSVSPGSVAFAQKLKRLLCSGLGYVISSTTEQGGSCGGGAGDGSGTEGTGPVKMQRFSSHTVLSPHWGLGSRRLAVGTAAPAVASPAKGPARPLGQRRERQESRRQCQEGSPLTLHWCSRPGPQGHQAARHPASCHTVGLPPAERGPASYSVCGQFPWRRTALPLQPRCPALDPARQAGSRPRAFARAVPSVQTPAPDRHTAGSSPPAGL